MVRHRLSVVQITTASSSSSSSSSGEQTILDTSASVGYLGVEIKLQQELASDLLQLGFLQFPRGISQATMLLPHKRNTHFTGARINRCNTQLVNHPGSLITGVLFLPVRICLTLYIYISSRVSFYDAVTFSNIWL